MFKCRVVYHSNVNGKKQTLQKDFDDYDSYREFIDQNPEYLPLMSTWDWWNPWREWDPILPDYQKTNPHHLDTSSFPKEVGRDKSIQNV
jgi:hypothetical protein